MNHATHTGDSCVKRIWSLDLLRILATFGIVVLHMSGLPVEYTSVNALPWKIDISVKILFRWCVPVFFMISGVLFLSDEREISVPRLYGKTILRIVTCFLFWSAFYAAVHCMIMGKGKWTFLNQLLRGHYHMWYIFAILGLYMLTPLLRKMTQSKTLTEYFLKLGFVFTFLLPQILGYIQMFPVPHADVIASVQSAASQLNPLQNAHALYYFVLGHYLYAYPVHKTRRNLLILSGILGYVLTVALTFWHSGVLGSVSSRFYDTSSITVLAMSAGMLLLFKHAFAEFVPGKRMKRWLIRLSSCAFGVYLVHPFFIERLQLELPPVPVFLIVGIPVLSLGIFALSFAVSAVLHRIPYLNRYIV